MEIIKQVKAEAGRVIRTIATEAPVYSRLLAQDSAAAFSGSVIQTVGALSRTNPGLVEFLAGLAMVASGSCLLEMAREPVISKIGSVLRRTSAR